MSTWEKFKNLFRDNPPATGTKAEPGEESGPKYHQTKLGNVIIENPDGTTYNPKEQDHISRSYASDQQRLQAINLQRAAAGLEPFSSLAEADEASPAVPRQWTNY